MRSPRSASTSTWLRLWSRMRRLGNGGLGRPRRLLHGIHGDRRRACIRLLAYRYMHGLFRQQMADGWQVELPETWLAHGNPWEFERRGKLLRDRLRRQRRNGQHRRGSAALRVEAGRARYRHRLRQRRPWDGGNARSTRFASGPRSRSTPSCSTPSMPATISGRCAKATRRKPDARALSGRRHSGRPGTQAPAGIFSPPPRSRTSCAVILQQYPDFTSLPDAVAIQLNDTHPAVSVAELVRLLTDVHGLDFETGLDISRRTFSYTNHTLLPEALESWPVPPLRAVAAAPPCRSSTPINRQDPDRGTPGEARDGRGDPQHLADRRKRATGGCAWGQSRLLRLANSINGVSALHTELMKETVFADLHGLYPDRIKQQDQRHHAAPVADAVQSGSFRLIRAAIGDEFMDNTEALSGPRRLCRQGGFPGALAAVKRAQQGAAAQSWSRRISASGSIPRRCSTSRSSESTNTSGSC